MQDSLELIPLAGYELRVPRSAESGRESTDVADAPVTVTFIPTYEFADGSVVSFRKANHVPGCSHRVAIDGMGVDYLEDGAKPSADCARAFHMKHVVRGGL